MNWKWISWLWDWTKKNKKMPKIEDIKGIKPKVEDAGCGCDLSGVVVRPLQFMGSFEETDKILAAGGYECGGFPLDIRCCLMRPDGRAWVYKQYVGHGVKLLGNNTFSCQCFDNPHAIDSRYHFIGWSKSDLPKDIIKAKAGDILTYSGTCFVYFELRLKK